MNQIIVRSVESQLLERRDALRTALSQTNQPADLQRLLVQVDQALTRLDSEEFDRCAFCGGRMEAEEMLENPMRRYCLCDLTVAERAALQRDLDLAWQVQASLLPTQNLSFANWQTHFRYIPAGPVSGDYCDLLSHEADGGWLYFLVGDVSGKGVAAAYWMAHLSALVRSTLDRPVTVADLVATVNRHLTGRQSNSHFVTLAAGRAHRSGRVEISSAGHCRPLVIRGDGHQFLDSTGIPVGIADAAEFQTTELHLSSGESLLLYSDGITETCNSAGDLYGEQMLDRVVTHHHAATPTAMAAACLGDLAHFRGPVPSADDITLLILKKNDE